MNDTHTAAGRERRKSAARESRLWALLQNPDTALRRHAVVALLVSIPVWIYATTWDVMMMDFINAAYGQPNTVRDTLQMVFNRLLVFPLLLAAYLIAINIPFHRPQAARFFFKQGLIALAFSILIRPAEVAAELLTHRNLADSHLGASLVLSSLFDYWQHWLYLAIQYSIVYLLGLMIIFGINAFLRYKSERLRSEQMRSRLLEARLGLLRGQFNPHFLFNALNLIVSLINTEPKRARTLVMQLSTLLRSSLAESSHEFTTLRKEMEFIERYLEIMQARYEDRLHIATAIDPRTLDCAVPGFMLMPLVENAIKHGVDRQPGRNTVEISGDRTGDMITISVRNLALDGDALPREPGGGTGLRNVRHRLSVIYGNRYRLEYGPDRQKRWVTSVAVPFLEVDSAQIDHHEYLSPAKAVHGLGAGATLDMHPGDHP